MHMKTFKRSFFKMIPPIPLSLGMALFLAQITGLAAQEVPVPGVEGRVIWLDPGREAVVEVAFEIPPGAYQAHTPGYFFLKPAGENPLVWEETRYPGAGTGREALPDIKYRDRAVLKRTLRKAGEDPWPREIRVTAGWQLCSSDGTCFMPGLRELTLKIPPRPEAGSGLQETGAAAAHPPGGGFSGPLRLLTILALALAGGLLLNLMPCVLPLLSVKAMQLIKQSRDNRRLILRNALLYTAGILASFLVLALLVILLKASGRMAGWGFQFQNPGFVLFLTALIWVFALSLFDLYVLNPVGAGVSQRASQHGGGWGSFLTGIFAVLVATPCTAPFLGTAMAYAFTQPPAVILAVFAATGIGLAGPFLLLGFLPGILRWFPRPGRWMGIFKEAMGFLLIGTALHLLKVLHSQLAVSAFWNTLWFFLVLTAAAWLYGKTAGPASRRMVRNTGRLAALLLAIGGAVLFVDLRPPSAGAAEEQASLSSMPREWERFSGEALREYRNQGTPVLVVFSAEWCLTCQTNEQTVLKTEKMSRLLKDTGTAVLYGDYTRRDPEISRYIQAWGRAGVPVYAYWPAGSQSPRLLPEVLTWGMVQKALSGSE